MEIKSNNMYKINKENIKKHLNDNGWTDESFKNNEIELICCKSPNKQYSLFKRPLVHEDNDNIHSYILQINDSKMCLLASCDVEYIEQINALIKIFNEPSALDVL